MLNRSSSSIKSDRNVFATPKSGTPSSVSSQIPSAKLTVGIGKRVRDIVAIFPQGEPVEPSKLCFSEQLNRVDKKVFTMTSLANTEFSSKPLHIDHVGIEEPPGNGFEYVLAIVDRNTGRPIEFKPAALVSFQPRFQPGEELLNGRKRKSVTNYSQDFSMSFDEMRTERNNLTKSFGSAKNVKKLEANIRRSITNETLDAMSTTAFSSPNTSIKKEEFDDSFDSPSTTATLDDDKSKLLSILEKGTSGMLPKPNYDAKVPSDVYKLEQFLPDNFDQFKSGYEQESLKYFKSVDSFQYLINSGVSPLVAKRVGIPSRYANPGIRCTVALKMVVLSKFVQYCFKKKSRALSISVGDVEAFQLPSLMSEYFRKKYLGEGTGKNAIKFQIPVDKKNRALVDLLCLLLLFDEPDFMLPLSPLVQELGVNETMLKNYLTGLGCIVSSATEAQALTMNTANTYS
uniref:Uncharacterized protein n=1 Tax=Meloidogyne incognita TaxID=6306 RepID=A0A914KS60_MELIC